MGSIDFQEFQLGLKFTSPYSVGWGVAVQYVLSSDGAGGEVRSVAGFIGLDIGYEALVTFDQPVFTVRALLYCGSSTTTTMTFFDPNGGKLASRKQAPDRNPGIVAYAAAGVSKVLFSQRLAETYLLRLDWDAAVSDTSHGAVGTPPISTESLAAAVYAATASWRVRGTRTQDLDRARFLVALDLLSLETWMPGIEPTERDLDHPLIEAIWLSCKAAAAGAIRARLAPERLNRLWRALAPQKELGPFVDLADYSSPFILVREAARLKRKQASLFG